jgi:hypothetical protein
MKQHKWYEIIVAWAQGETIQYRYSNEGEWVDEEHPNPPWASPTVQFRVKPQEAVTRTYYMRCQLDLDDNVVSPWNMFNPASVLQEPEDNLKLTFKDNKLVKAELL